MLRRNLQPKAEDRTVGARSGFVPGLVVVRWKSDVISARAAHGGARVAASALPQQVTDRLSFLKRNHGLKQIVDLSPTKRSAGARGALRAARLAVARSLDPERGGLRGVTMLRFGEKADTRRIAKLIDKDAVDLAQPVPARWAAASTIPADPHYISQWGLVAIDWFEAKRKRAGSVKVAILDSGVDRGHPDLARAVAHSDYETMGFSSTDHLGHGTHVAGIIAATANNRIGIAGVADCKLACWKVFGDRNPENVDNEAYYRALEAAGRARGVRVMNLSLGGFEKDQLEFDLIEGLVKAGRVLVVAAMGNEYEDGNPIEYPAAIPGVVAVGAVRPNRRRAGFSNTGKHISLVAPGTSILSTLPLKASGVRAEVEYEAWDGTSMATPFVAGAAALLFAAKPEWSAEQVRNRLLATTMRVEGMNGKSWSAPYGRGLLNVRKALAMRKGARR